MNEFEQKLACQSLGQAPDEWRAEILSAAKSAVSATKQNEYSPTAGPIPWWRELFWPHPKAWAGLAAIWVLIFIVNISMREKSQAIAEKVAPPSPEIVAELRQQKLLFAELIGSTETSVADRQKLFSPRPRSARVEILTA